MIFVAPLGWALLAGLVSGDVGSQKYVGTNSGCIIMLYICFLHFHKLECHRDYHAFITCSSLSYCPSPNSLLTELSIGRILPPS